MRRRNRLVFVNHRATQIVQFTLAIRHYSTLCCGMKLSWCHYASLFGGNLVATCQAVTQALLEILLVSLVNHLILMHDAVISSGMLGD